jgi:hypothetical protein
MKAKLWTARILSGIVILFLLVDGVTKILHVQPVLDAFVQLGIPVERATFIGVVVTLCAIVYAIPRTAVLGGVLIVGLLGGAIATHVRADSDVFATFIFPAVMAALTWIPLYLRYEGVRSLLFGR